MDIFIDLPATRDYEIGGRVYTLPLVKTPSGVQFYSIATLLGDVWLNEYWAGELAKIVPNDVEVLVCVEAKAIALTHCIARNLNHSRYVIIRKSKKTYMKEALMGTVKSITTVNPQEIFLNGTDYDYLQNKKYAFVDDVISTGGSYKGAIQLLMEVAKLKPPSISLFGAIEGKEAEAAFPHHITKLLMFNKYGIEI